MKITLLAVADKVVVHEDQKMDLTGIFATMYFPRLPGLANLGIGARVEYAPDEVGIEIPMRVALSDPDEKIVFEATLPVPGLLTQRPGVRPAVTLA